MKKVLIFVSLSVVLCCWGLAMAEKVNEASLLQVSPVDATVAKDATIANSAAPDRLVGSLDEGGEGCTTGTVIAGLPYSDSGNTCDNVNDTDVACTYTGSTSPDVSYLYTPSANEQVTLTLCIGATNYDSKIYVHDVSGGMALVACNDDACSSPVYASWVSRLDCIALARNHQYCITVDGYGGDCGDYYLNITICQPCIVECQAGDVLEAAEGPFDLTNAAAGDAFSSSDPDGGCNNGVGLELYGSLECGQTVCGRGFTYVKTAGATRDTDWYRFTLAVTSTVTWTVTAEYPVYTYILNNVCPAGTLSPVGIGGACVPATTTALCLPPGTYVAWTGPQVFTGIPVSEYRGTLTCDPCPPPPECHCLESGHCNTSGGFIADASTLSTTVDVGVEYHITDVNLCLDIQHTWLGDMYITLTSPSGTVVEIWANSCGNTDNMPCITFDDEASGFHACPPTFAQVGWPQYGFLSDFDDENAYGTWTLDISDCCGGDTGPLNYWCLSFEYDEILPVAFGSLSAIAGNNAVQLNWNTESETANDRFEIMRDGATVGEVDATNSSTGSTYNWVDNNAHNGTTYSYTLVSVDMSGNRDELAMVSATPNSINATVTEYALMQNYPNPFNPETNISFDLVDAGMVKLNVYNMLGQQVATLVNGSMEAGRHVVSFNAANLPSGLYLYRLEAGEFSAQMKMVLMK